MRGKNIRREAKPLFDSPLVSTLLKNDYFKGGANAPSNYPK